MPKRAAALAVLALTLLIATPAAAASPLVIASDPFTQSTCHASAVTNHHANVEPDSFSFGSTIVAAYQVGRIYDGGACAIGFSTSTNNGATWTSGLLPSLTKYTTPAGSFDRATDAAVAYDAQDNVWMISSLVLTEAGGVQGVGIYTSRSTDGGLTWGTPVAIPNTAGMVSPDKNWIVCDNTASSPFYGNCYTEWDDNGAGNRMEMSRSTDGGLTWSVAVTNNAGIIGGQPVVRPDGTVVVPTANANETAIGAFNSTNGGVSWSAVTTIATIKHHTVAGGLREGPLPSAEIDGAGTVYVVWTDCRFIRGCKANDIVISHSLNATGTSWSAVTRVPIDGVNTGIDHFIPGLAVNKATSGASAQLGLTYYFYPKGSTQLGVGFISSANAGATWTAPQIIASGMTSTWAATTSQGRMVGDYISTSYGSDNLAHGIFGAANTPTTGAATSCSTSALDNCVAPIDTFTPGLASGSFTGLNDAVLFTGNGGADAASFWNIVDNEGIRHRD
ncbi:MAG TPA: sialidase family protein [Candidatus Limnocylindrales bacterium]|nr:sialidase family protein [Candidatus Limnocylindrales bacterium]